MWGSLNILECTYLAKEGVFHVLFMCDDDIGYNSCIQTSEVDIAAVQ